MVEIILMVLFAMLGGAILGVNRSLIGSVGKESGSIMASIITKP